MTFVFREPKNILQIIRFNPVINKKNIIDNKKQSHYIEHLCHNKQYFKI